MKLKAAPFPQVRLNESSRSIFADVLVPLCLLTVIPFIYVGGRVAVTILTPIVTCVLAELVFCIFAKKQIPLSDMSAIITGFIIAMLLPVTVPLYVPVCASVFAICIVKMPFGGMGKNIFNPAAAGVAFSILCFSEEVFKYRDTKLISPLPFFGSEGITYASSPLSVIAEGKRPDIYSAELLLGNFPGPLGTTTVLVIAACFLYMVMRRTISWHIPVCFVAASAFIAFCWPRIPGSRWESVLFELISGALVFCAVFVATEPVTSPKTKVGRVLYGILGGVLTMLMRYFGSFEEGVCFAILLINAIAPQLDKVTLIIKKAGESETK